MVVTSRLFVAMGIAAETVVANGVGAPIGMAMFPAVETVEPEGVADQPDIAGSEIEILVAHETDVFITIPHVIVRNGHHGWGNDHRRRRRHRDDRGIERYSSGLDDATGHQHKPSCCH